MEQIGKTKLFKAVLLHGHCPNTETCRKITTETRFNYQFVTAQLLYYKKEKKRLNCEESLNMFWINLDGLVVTQVSELRNDDIGF